MSARQQQRRGGRTMRSQMGLKYSIGSFAALALALLCTSASAQRFERAYVDAFGGVMTENRWNEIFDPSEFRLASSGLLGVGIGWERQIGTSRFHFGAQLQVVAHVGRQDHIEANLPVVLRYVPPDPVPRGLRSAAFGLGLSYASKTPQVEIDRTGASQRTYAYWLAELEFDLPPPDRTAFIRLHHRSDAYGLFEIDSGSTAIAFGVRFER